MTTSAVKVAAAGIAGAGGSGGAVYGTYYLVTYSKSTTQEEEDKEVKESKILEEKKKELKTWMETNKCVIKITVTGGSSNPIDLKTGSPEDDLINGFWTWWSKEDNKTSLGCPGSSGTDKDVNLTTTNKSQFTNQGS